MVPGQGRHPALRHLGKGACRACWRCPQCGKQEGGCSWRCAACYPGGATAVCRAPCRCFCPSTAAVPSNALPPCRPPQEDLNVDDAFAAIARNALRNEAEEEPFVPETVELGAAAAPRRAQSSCC